MKLTRQVTVKPAEVITEEINVEFPAFYCWKDSYWTHYYKLISEREAIRVNHFNDKFYSITYDKQDGITCIALDDAVKGKVITSEEFTEKFNEAITVLNAAFRSELLVFKTPE